MVAPREEGTKVKINGEYIENISDIVRDELKELQDIEMRRLHMVCFNLPESENQDSDQRKYNDKIRLKSLINEDMKLSDKNIEVENPIRLGKKMEDPQSNNGTSTNPNSKKGNRPLRFKVGKFEDKRLILQANSELKNSEDENLNNIFVTPDQTRRQREESFKL